MKADVTALKATFVYIFSNRDCFFVALNNVTIQTHQAHDELILRKKFHVKKTSGAFVDVYYEESGEVRNRTSVV